MGNSFAIFASVKLLWNFIDKSRLQSFRRTFTRIGNSVCPYRIWLVMTASVYVKNWNLDPRNKFYAIPRFTAGIICGPYRGSFAVRDHLRSNLGIIYGRGSFVALYNVYLNKIQPLGPACAVFFSAWLILIAVGFCVRKENCLSRLCSQQIEQRISKQPQ